MLSKKILWILLAAILVSKGKCSSQKLFHSYFAAEFGDASSLWKGREKYYIIFCGKCKFSMDFSIKIARIQSPLMKSSSNARNFRMKNPKILQRKVKIYIIFSVKIFRIMKKALKAHKSFSRQLSKYACSAFNFDSLIFRSFFWRFRERIEYSLISLTVNSPRAFVIVYFLKM